MELFAAAGVELPPRAGRGRSIRGMPRLRVPLLAYNVVRDARALRAFAPTREQAKAAADYARKCRTAKFAALKETAVRPLFIQDILQKVLGYRPVDPESPYTLDHERAIRLGAVDVAIGRFNAAGEADRIVAPFELKGPSCADLDRIEAGRGRSPVQQAWDYAIDAPGSQWVLVSNCLEIRLYAFGRGRDAYELFDLSRLDDIEELTRLWLVLAEGNLLGGTTDALLRATDSAYKDVTNDLYLQYKGMRERLVAFLTGSADGPKLPALDAIEPAQTILDRILFIAFAQRNNLLPDRLLEDAAKEQNKFNPEPIWSNFLALFRMVDGGNNRLAIWAFNGGLFAPDAVVDTIVLPDDLARDIAALGQWDYRREVPVTVLGHIFEQSITDIETLKAESRGLAPPPITKRKREGVVYTPDIVTRFLVERTIALTLDERRARLWSEHGLDADAPPERETAFWQAYLEVLRAFTIVDPACGSGAFLVAAFDELARRYRAVQGRLLDLGVEPGFDLVDEIVTKNLYGVDLNAESVEITRLSLWLKTARRDHRLQSLEATIRCGNSLVDDPSLTDRPFVWEAAFPAVFANGGFDTVIGNPPYVRMELLKPVKPYLARHYAVAAERADLYAYFFEKGLTILKPGGRLGFISSSTFFRTSSGETLRRFLAEGAAIESVVDFGDLQIFEGVTTYPAILTMRKDGEADADLSFVVIDDQLPADLGLVFNLEKRSMPQRRLGQRSWQFEDEPVALLRDKIMNKHATLGEVYGAPLYGIKTGYNEAFVISSDVKNSLMTNDPAAAEFIKPFFLGEDIRKWSPQFNGRYLINIPHGWTRRSLALDASDGRETDAWAEFSLRFPHLSNHLSRFAEKARPRSDQGHFWWELRACAYLSAFARRKIVFSHFMDEARFAFDDSGSLASNKCYFFPDAEHDLLSLLNSTLSWFMLKSWARRKRGRYFEAEIQYVSRLPVPEVDSKIKKQLQKLGSDCSMHSLERSVIQSAVHHRILDFAPPERRKLTERLERWHTLDFAAFRAAVTSAFRVEIALRERADWEAFLAENAARVRDLTRRIETAERAIDTLVYRLFDLSADEVALLERSIGPR